MLQLRGRLPSARMAQPISCRLGLLRRWNHHRFSLSEDVVDSPASEPYRAYVPRPFTKAERRHVTILFGGAHWRAERVLEGVLENLGYRARALPPVSREDLLKRTRTHRHRSVLPHDLHHSIVAIAAALLIIFAVLAASRF